MTTCNDPKAKNTLVDVTVSPDNMSPPSNPKVDKTIVETPVKSHNVFAKRMLTAVNFFVETNRLEPYTAVYLINIIGWNEVSFGIVSLCMNMAMLIFQTPAGDLLDKATKGKKIITSIAILVASVTTVMVIWTSNFWAILVGKTIEGISATIFLPALMALLLGICRTEEEVPLFIATTEVSNKVGSFLIVCACAAISYFAYPNVDALFYLLGAGGLIAAFFTSTIPESEIHHDRARQLAKADETSEDDVKTESPSRYLDLLKDKGIVGFAALTFLYHLANAGVVPLLAQYVATVSSEQSNLTWVSAILIVFFFSQAITAHLMTFVVNKFDPKRIILIAFIVLPIRCTFISIMILFWSNPWALVSTQIFDGIGAGVYDTMLPIIVKNFTKGSGRFGFTYGFIITCWRIGHGLSLLLGEAIVHSFGYATAFWVLGSIGLINFVSFVLFSRSSTRMPKHDIQCLPK